MLKILHLSEDFLPGGISKHIVDLTNHSLITDIRMYVAATPSRYVRNLDPLVPFLPLKLTKSEQFDKSITGVYSSFKTIIQLIRSEKIDLLHSHKRYAHFLGYIISRITKIPHITSFHSEFKGKKLITVFGDYSICCSEAVFQQMINKYEANAKKTEIIHYGIKPFKNHSNEFKRETCRNLNIPDGATVISSVGNYIHDKDRKSLIKALKLVSDRRDVRNLFILLVGHGPLEASLRKLVADLNINQTVRFVDCMYDVESIMNISDFLILNSISEAFGIVLLEAASIGKIHIGTNVGGIPEFIDNGQTGLLVEKANAIQLADAIEYLLDNPDKRKMMEENAKQKYETSFQFPDMFSKIERIYKSVIG